MVRADPYGAVELGEVIGREADVDRLWSALIEGNVVLHGRYGIGKTTVARLAMADAPTGWEGRHVALGGLDSAAAATAALLDALSVDAGESVQATIAPVLDDSGKAEADKLDGDPSAMLRLAIEAQLDDRSAGLVLVFDDFDQFSSATAAAKTAAELEPLSAALHELSGAETRVRVLLLSNTYVDRTLARLGAEQNPLVASCQRLRLEALRPDAGARLVSALLLGESITARDRAALARALSDNCDHVPRWIHCAMATFVARGKPILDGDLERCLVEAVADLDAEPWVLRRELTPVLDDYWQPQRGLALSILDQLALAEDEVMTFERVVRQMSMEAKIDDDAIARVIDELYADQLIDRSGDELRFCGELLRMAWLKLRFM